MHKWIGFIITACVCIILSACELPAYLQQDNLEKQDMIQKITLPSATRKEEEGPKSLIKIEEIPEKGYAFGYLTEQEKIWYLDILRSLQNMEDGTVLSEEPIKEGLEGEDIDRVFQSVVLDHPELFYVTGYEYTGYRLGDKLVSLEFTGQYSCTREEVNVRAEEIEVAVGVILNRLRELDSQYAICKSIYETIILETEYSLEATENQNIYSVFVNHASVCQGYAKAFQYLCLRMGMESTLIIGEDYTGEGHAWNLVQLEGNYYLSDITWGEANYKQEDRTGVPEMNYDFFLVTSEEMNKTHLDQLWFPLPKCVSKECNYFVKEGCYLEQYDEAFLQELFSDAVSEGKSQVSIKFANKQVYQQVKEELVDKGSIFSFWNREDKQLFYSSNEDVNTMTFWMTNE